MNACLRHSASLLGPWLAFLVLYTSAFKLKCVCEPPGDLVKLENWIG